MGSGIYQLIDKFFFVFHASIILFNLTGWIWRKTRILHLTVVGLTAFSWFVLGIWYGLGYCPCTDWHWQVREKLGYQDMPSSYIQFLLRTLTPLNLPDATVDAAVMVFFIVPIGLSVVLFIIDLRKRRGKT